MLKSGAKARPSISKSSGIRLGYSPDVHAKAVYAQETQAKTSLCVLDSATLGAF
jgi:hypothetical protein